MERIVHINNFDKGLVTNVDQGDLPLNSMVKLQNMRNDKPGMLRGAPGFVKFADLPSTIEGDVRHFQEVVLNDVQILICWGLDSGSVQHFYYSIDTGSNWIEITEINFFEVDTRTSDTVFTIQVGTSPFDDTPNSSTSDYYKNWFIYWFDVGTPANFNFDYVTVYDQSTLQITVQYGLTNIAANDTLILMRFPVWFWADLNDLVNANGSITNLDRERNKVRDAANFKPTIIQRENAVAIHCGRKQDVVGAGIIRSLNNNPRPRFNAMWFGYLETGNLFDHSVLSYTDYHAEHLHLYEPDLSVPTLGTSSELVSAFTSSANTVDPVPDNKRWVYFLTFVYDGFQETYVFWNPETLWGDNQVLDLSASTNREIDMTLNWERFPVDELGSVGNEFEHNITGSRRLTAIRTYIAQVTRDTTSTNNVSIPSTPFVLVNEIKINDPRWAGTSQYNFSFTIQGTDFEVGKKFEAELVHGYFSRCRVNADLATVVAGKEVVASIVSGDEQEKVGNKDINTSKNTVEESKSTLVYPAINLANRVTPDLHPETDFKNMSENGIYEIFNIKPLNNLLAVFGENKLVLLDGTEEVDSYEGRGVNGFWSVVSKGEKLFWGNLDSMYELVQGGRPNEIGFPIRGDWQAISAANRKKSIAVYDNKFNTFILHSPNGTTYIYDESRKSWRTYVSTTTFEWLSIGVDGEVLATDKTDIFHLFPDSGSTETLTGTVEWILDFEDYVSMKFIEILYKLTGVITVKVFDLEKNDSYHIAEVKFFAKTEFDNEPQKLSFRAKKIRLQLTIVPTAASNFDYEIDDISLHGTKSIQVNQ